MLLVQAMVLLSMSPVAASGGVGMIDPPASNAKPHVMVVGSQAGEVDLKDGAYSVRFVANEVPGSAPQAGGPWLGIAFGPVAKPLASQLRLDAGTGQVVTNVVEGSPADTAGLQQYDIITAIDGQNVSSKIDDFMSVIRGYKPGETHSLTLVRGGQRTSATITVGARPEEIGASKYKNDEDEISSDRIFNRGGMLQKVDEGNWVFKNFNQADLPDVWKFIPDAKDFNVKVPFGSVGSNMQIMLRKDDGHMTRIETGDDGKVTVTTTTTENGKESTSTKTYNTEDEFKAAEPELSKSMCFTPGSEFHLFGDADLHIQGLDDEAKAKIHEAMKNAHGAMGQANVFMKKMDDGSGAPGSASAFAFGRKAKTSFETTSDGKIRVTTRSGGEELVTVYDNADALRVAQPELHKKYLRLQDSQGGTTKN